MATNYIELFPLKLINNNLKDRLGLISFISLQKILNKIGAESIITLKTNQLCKKPRSTLEPWDGMAKKEESSFLVQTFILRWELGMYLDSQYYLKPG